MSSELQPEEIKKYHNNGFIGPHRAFSEDRAHDILKTVQEKIKNTDEHPSGYNVPHIHDRHIDLKEVYEVCQNPSIVDRISSLYGDDLLLWSSRVWEKESGGLPFPWHQGDHFHPIEPPVTLTAWVALTETNHENGAIQVIPGSHEKVLPHVEAGEDQGFTQMADPSLIDESDAVTMDLNPGEFFIFNERCLHRSSKNSSDNQRVGLSVRITLPFVKTNKPYGTILVRGEDQFGFNKTVAPPKLE